MQEFDLIVIGSGPAGEKAAVKAAYFGHKVALVEKVTDFGGAGVQTGTLPSKTLKETALYLSGTYHKGIFSIDRELSRQAGLHDFMFRKDVVAHDVEQAIQQNLLHHKVTIFRGTAEFVDNHHIKVSELDEVIKGKYFIIATGSYPYHPNEIPFEYSRVHDSDSILKIERFPRSLCVLGAGVIGCEYATMFSAMGIKTYMVNDRDKILGFLDNELSHALVEGMKKSNVSILFNNSITGFRVPSDPTEDLEITLATGEQLKVDMFLFAAGRSGNTLELKCQNAGIKTGPRQTILVDDKFQTNVPNIYAVGDVIGFPALASTGMDQGRIAVAHIFKTGDLEELTQIFPYGIYTIPEVSMVGLTEQQAIDSKVPYATGYSFYRDTTRGKIIGDRDNGFLKLIFEKDTKIITGVHIIGMIATELIHYGMALVKDKKTLDEVIATVFNYPTLHDLYKYAAYDGLGSLSGKKIKKAGEIFASS